MPSTSTPGSPYSTAFCANVGDAVWTERGTEIAQPLLRQIKMTGILNTAAKFALTWKVGVDVAPSPKKPTATSSFFCSLAAHAAPTACGICDPTGELIETKFNFRAVWCTGICRPFTGSSALPNIWHMNVRSG